MVHCPHAPHLNALMDVILTLTAVGQHQNAVARIQKPVCVYQIAIVADRLLIAIRTFSHLNVLNVWNILIVLRSANPNAEHMKRQRNATIVVLMAIAVISILKKDANQEGTACNAQIMAIAVDQHLPALLQGCVCNVPWTRIVPRRPLRNVHLMSVCLALSQMIVTLLPKINVLRLYHLQSVCGAEMIMIAAEPLLNVIQLQIPVLLVLIAHIVLQKRLPNAQHRILVLLAVTQMIATLLLRINV